MRLLAVALLSASLFVPPAWADNQMGYRLMDARQASQLPRGGGLFGLDVGRGQIINEPGMTFELLQVRSVRPNAPAATAGLAVGDQVIAVDGLVFPSVAAFAGYVSSLPPGRTLAIDYLPRGGGPEQAQRVGVTLAGATRSAPAPATQVPSESRGLSTGQKIAIGAGAVALFGCYKMGCFSRVARPQ